jgi:hypothetical protein
MERNGPARPDALAPIVERLHFFSSFNDRNVPETDLANLAERG